MYEHFRNDFQCAAADHGVPQETIVDMLGLLEEIKGLFRMGIPEKATAMQAIGYKEFVDYLAGNCTLEEACAQVQQSSRHYAKRQLTWFRKNPQIHWLTRKPGQNTFEILQSVRQILGECDN